MLAHALIAGGALMESLTSPRSAKEYELRSNGANAGESPDSLETRFFRGLQETRRIELDSARLVLVAENGRRLTFVLVANRLDPAVR